MKENPYTPPDSLGQRLAECPRGFEVDGDSLLLQDGAVLPEVCLGTGVTEDLTRYERSIHWTRPRIHLGALPMALVVYWFASSLVTILIFIAWTIILGLFQRKLTVSYSVGRQFKRQQLYWMSGIGIFGIGVMTAIVLLPVSFEIKAILIYLSLVDGIRLLTVLLGGIRVKKIAGGVGVLVNVNPAALVQLEQWNDPNGEG